MQNIFLIILIVFSTCINFSQGRSNETKSILILFGLSPAQPAYQPILDGIRQKLTEEFGDNYDIHTEYLELENYSKDNYLPDRFRLYNEKYRKIKLDLLICIGRGAVGVIKNYAEKHLLNLPTISVDFDFSNYGIIPDLSLNNNTAVVGIKFNIDKMISTALSVFPNTTSIYFIGGTSTFDKLLMSIANRSSSKINIDRKLEFISDLSMDSILHLVKNLPVRSIIFIPSFNTDSKKVTYFNPEAIRLISLSANSPVFAYSDMGFGEGAVGGYQMSFRKVGLLSGESAVKILNRTDPNSLVIKESDYYENVFDWRELKRWKIQDSKLLTEGSIIMFKEINLLEEYKWIFGAGLLFLVLQSILIVNLVRLNKNQKLMTQQVIKSENKYREFVDQDRILRLGQLTASLSHELNQPLTAILSNAQAAVNFINSNQATPELLKQILQKIVDNDKRAASILSSIRGLMKLENREKEKTDLNVLIQEVIDVYRSEARKLLIKMFVHISNEPIYVLVDKVQIQQVLLNLLFNASQSMQRSNTADKIIEVNQYFNKGEVIVSVRDYGEGIDEQILAKLFKPFVTSRSEGMGIGLAICSSIIEEHNGKIWAENLPDGGAKFSFSLNIFNNE